MDKIIGQRIIKIIPVGSMYHNDCINVTDDKKNHYLIKVAEIMKIPTDFASTLFNIIPKTKHKYLEVNMDYEEDVNGNICYPKDENYNERFDSEVHKNA
jgi:hypothetical protein